jgi:hypothetical protein
MCWSAEEPQSASNPNAAIGEDLDLLCNAPEKCDRILGAPNLATGEAEWLCPDEDGVFSSLERSASPDLVPFDQIGGNGTQSNVPAAATDAPSVTTSTSNNSTDFSPFLSN